jgi:L-malate glycosyltransferase
MTMRLCFIADPSIHTQRILHYFVGAGYEVHLLATRPPSSPLAEGVKVHDLTALANVRKLRFLVWAYHARRIVHELRPDVLHAHQVAGPGWVGAATGYHPLVVTAWGSDLLVNPRRSQVQRQLARWVLRQADYVTCVSQSLAQAALALGAVARHLEVAPWGIDTNVFQPATSKEMVRAALGLRPGPLVLSPRSLKAVYNPVDIARAIPKILEQVPAAQFVVRTHVCDLDLLGQFQAIVQDSEAAAAVHYVGDLPAEQAVADLYRAADVIVSVPSSDGTPSSVLEAMACGAVPVLSDVPSLHEWVRHECEALFVPIGDVTAISAAVIRLLANDTLRSAMAANGSQLVSQRADSQVWMAHAEEMYRRLISQGQKA